MRHLDSATPVPQPSSARWTREGDPDMFPTVARSCARDRPCGGSTPRIQPRLRRDIMHPMFKELFIDTGTDDLAAEDDQRRRARRSRQARPAMIIRPAAGNRDNQPRP